MSQCYQEIWWFIGDVFVFSMAMVGVVWTTIWALRPAHRWLAQRITDLEK